MSGLAPLGRRAGVAAAALVLGAVLSLALLLTGATPGVVLIPFGMGFVLAALVLPFPAADYALALGLLGTFPLLPPLGLPNLPLAAVVIGIALVRVVANRRETAPARSALLVAGVWSLVVIGALISHWPPLGVWLRPAAVIAIGFGAALLGLLVWADAERRTRWLAALSAGTLVVAVSGLAVFALQYVRPVDSIVEMVVATQGYLRGDAAATAFDAVNNWRIRGEPVVMRAVSPLFPAPNSLGGYLGIGMPLAAVVMLSSSASRRARALGAAALMASIVALVVTYSRSSWVAASLALAVVGLIALLARRRAQPGDTGDPRLPARSAVTGVVALVLVAGVVGLGGIVTTSNANAWERIVAASEDRSVQERIEGDAKAVQRIQAGLLRGTGLGNWTGRSASDPPTRGEHTPYVHNIYLEYSGATGILGGMWVALVFGVTIVGGAIAALRGRRQTTVLGGLALVAIGVYGATQGMFDDNFLNPQLAWLNAWAFGGGAAMLAGVRSAAGAARSREA